MGSPLAAEMWQQHCQTDRAMIICGVSKSGCKDLYGNLISKLYQELRAKAAVWLQSRSETWLPEMAGFKVDLTASFWWTDCFSCAGTRLHCRNANAILNHRCCSWASL
jgi:hypothetical protein